MALRNIDGVPHLSHAHGAFPLVLPPDALSPKEHDFRTDNLQYTEFGVILPTPAFSFERFKALQKLAERKGPPSGVSMEAYAVARALVKRQQAKPVSFDDKMGCWELPLVAETDKKGRARYPHFAIRALNTFNTSAHKLTYSHLRGKLIPMGKTAKGDDRSMPVDHLCHRHACCNPYHLEVVTPAVNSARGRTVRRDKVQQSLFHAPSSIMSFEDLAEHLRQYEAIVAADVDPKESIRKVVAGVAIQESFAAHPTLFE